ncbi:MAG TPA: sugar transferase [Bacteroidales bacterium]|nr:sugar transferase [Bacteroidales bacterium]
MNYRLNLTKRLIDVVLSSIGLIFLSIPIVFISLIIKVTGPVFFEQLRIGKNGKPFHLIKFRSMKIAAGKSAGSFDAGDSSRITPLGRFLRKTKLDELPQLINVLKGDMSIVGPRPEVKQWTEVYPEKWKIVHTVKPGITDNASIEFRNEEEILSNSNDPVKTYKEVILPRKLDLYVDYVNNHSPAGDLKIILKTIKEVLIG